MTRTPHFGTAADAKAHLQDQGLAHLITPDQMQRVADTLPQLTTHTAEAQAALIRNFADQMSMITDQIEAETAIEELLKAAFPEEPPNNIQTVRDEITDVLLAGGFFDVQINDATAETQELTPAGPDFETPQKIRELIADLNGPVTPQDLIYLAEDIPGLDADGLREALEEALESDQSLKTKFSLAPNEEPVLHAQTPATIQPATHNSNANVAPTPGMNGAFG